MVDEQQVDQLADELLEDLRDDWVSVMAMVWSAQRGLGLTEMQAIRDVVAATLVRLLDNPDVKVVTGDMGRELRTEPELVDHIHREWPPYGEIPVSGEVVWLVERDFDPSQGGDAGPPG